MANLDGEQVRQLSAIAPSKLERISVACVLVLALFPGAGAGKLEH